MTVIECPLEPDLRFRRPSGVIEAYQIREIHDRLCHGPIGQVAKVMEVAR